MTIKLFKTAILKFHVHPNQFHQDSDILALLKSFANSASPLPLDRTAVDLTQTLRHLIRIAPDATTSLTTANKVAAFLLGLAGLLRPSDLQRIQLSRCTLSDNRLTLIIAAPKERRQGRKIVKQVTIHPHLTVPLLCPVQAFLVLRDHPSAVSHRPPDALFVHSHRPSSNVQVQTISKWIRSLDQLSTDATPTPSVRSLGSDLAIRHGVPLDDVVTLGNWSSATVLDTHYRRQRVTQSNTTMSIFQAPIDDQEDSK